MNSQNDLENIMRNTAKPRKEFVHSLHKKMKEESQPNLLSLLSMNMINFFKSKAGISIIGIFALFGIGLGVFFTYQYRTMQDYQANNTSSAELLAKIQKANANKSANREIGLPSTSNSGTNASSLTTGDAQSLIARYPDPKERGYQFLLTEIHYSFGPSSAKCDAVAGWIIDEGITKVESSEYFENTTEYEPSHTRNAQYQGSKIYGLTIKQGNDVTEYLGGSYGVTLKNQSRFVLYGGVADSQELLKTDTQNEPEVKPNSTTETTSSTPATTGDLPISENNTSIIGKETVNGKEYHKIKTTYPVNCDRSTNTFNMPRPVTIVVESLADPDSYHLVTESYYIEGASAQNLIYKADTTITKRVTATLNDVQSYFTLKGITLRTVDAEQKKVNQEYYDANIAAIKASGTVLLSVDSGFEVTSIYSDRTDFEAESQKQYGDVAFYPSANDSRYKAYVENIKSAAAVRKEDTTPTARVSYQKAEGGQYFSIATYSTSREVTDLLQASYAGTKFTEQAKSSINIDGTTVVARDFLADFQQIAFPNSGSGIGASSDSSQAPDGQQIEKPSDTGRSRYIVFSYLSKTYVIESNGITIMVFPKFTANRPGSVNFDKMVALLRPTE